MLNWKFKEKNIYFEATRDKGGLFLKITNNKKEKIKYMNFNSFRSIILNNELEKSINIIKKSLLNNKSSNNFNCQKKITLIIMIIKALKKDTQKIFLIDIY